MNFSIFLILLLLPKGESMKFKEMLLSAIKTTVKDFVVTNGHNLFSMFLHSFSNFRHKPIREFVKFYCYQSNKPPVPVEVFMNDPLISRKLNTSLPLAFLIHGFTGSYKDEAFQQIVLDYIKYIQSNVCIVDWSYLGAMEYTLSANQTERVGNYTGDFIDHLMRYNYFTKNDILLCGFSLGAHVAGFAGARLNGVLPRVIGLEPAGPGFTQVKEKPKDKRLNPSVAQFVQVLHTDQNEFGADERLGDIDFYANGGNSPQPGCPTENKNLIEKISCSHSRALKIFWASLNPQNRFVGYRCDSYENYLEGLCDNMPSDVFGLYSSYTVRGPLYFQTTDTFPYV